MATYSKETAIYDTDKIADDISEAADAHKAYITEISGDGIWVTPSDGKPVNGDAVASTTGWHISNALEYFRLGVNWFKLWLDTSVNKMKMRLGNASYGHVIFDDSGIDVRKGNSSVANFGENVRIGEENSSRVAISPLSVSMENQYDTTMFDVSMPEKGDRYAYEVEYPINPALSGTVNLEIPKRINATIIAIGIRILATNNTYSSSGNAYLTSIGSSQTINIPVMKSGGGTDSYGGTITWVDETHISYTASHGQTTNTGGSCVNYIFVKFDDFDYATFSFGTRKSRPASYKAGAYSSTLGYELNADGSYQTVIGEFNNNDYANIFEVGNGTSDSARSNALEVQWNGTLNLHHQNASGVENGIEIIDESSNERSMLFGVGSGSTNRGVFDKKLNRWITYADDSSIYAGVIDTTSKSAARRSIGLAAGSFSVSVSANDYEDVSVTFPNSPSNMFSAAPVVTATLFSSGTAVNIGNICVSVHSITATGCKVRIFNNRNSAINPGVEWIAVGS